MLQKVLAYNILITLIMFLDLAVAMKSRGIDLVYGGGNWGLMGTTAAASVEQGLAITEVLPTFMKDSAGRHYGEVIWVETMAERKKKMADISDCFIGLPGGFGTIDELTEMLTWNQLGLQAKPIGLLNINGFWDHWVKWVERAVNDGMIKGLFADCMYVDDDPGRLLDKMASFTPNPEAAKFYTKA